MSAKNGSAVSFRSRGRVVACALVVVFALSAMLAATASAKVTPIKETYVSLGDSLAFGYSAQTFNENVPLGDQATAFESGYANDYFNLHNPKAHGAQLVNLGCPGETTDSLIGNGPLGGAVDPTGESPCGYHKAGYPLHHEYGGGKSQLESALEVIATEAFLKTPVTTVTFNIGANDELHAIAKCEAEVKAEYEAEGKSKYGATPEAAVKNCILAHVEGLFGHILHNVATTLFVLREGSKFGGVNYTGKIVIQGGYNPYGVLFKNAAEAAATPAWFATAKPPVNHTGEILAESNALTGALNVYESGSSPSKEYNEAFKASGACYANPQPRFNAGGHTESNRLQKWTNMDNQTVFTFEPAPGFPVTLHNGPDIHPTAAGYAQLAKVMKGACG